nr:mRNA cap guanine-N7 methyltransferase isoform X1 [Osmia lignaria]XP_034176303.1 mRNA cap guanine-N7 methyltransferase isoform X1 [Osmia lignaria]
MNEAERKILASPEQDAEQVLLGVNPETSNTNTNTKEENETKDKVHTQTKRKRSPDAEPSEKKRKHDIGQNLIDTSNLSIDNNKDTNESLKTRIHSDNTLLVARHYNSLGNEGSFHRKQSRILYMRNFNNWIKSILILEYADKIKQHTVHGYPIKVLDMCCGKGGDLFKWEKVKVSHVICADLAEISIEQCQDRYKELTKVWYNKRRIAPVFTAEFIAADCTKVHLRTKFKDPSIQLDFVSCQFAFHYCFETLQQAECMMKNASECLKPGGYFIGTIPDAYNLVSRWQDCDGNSFGNDIYNIEFFCDKTKPPLFGAKYHFQLEGLVNCPEFLVYLPVFRKLGRRFGLELVMFKRFDEYYECNKDKGRFLLNKMQALEMYPPNEGVKLVGKPDQDYQHLKHLKTSDRHKICSLSQSEWDIVTLYAVFAFQKMKTVWDSKGKPEYVKLEK